MKKWVILHRKIANIKEQMTNEEVIRILLKNRGLTKKNEIKQFLHPSLDQLNFKNLPINQQELDKATKRIKKAIDKKESIVVYTDYDVDGICSGALVWEALYQLGAKVMPYVPHREKEGYGLSKQGIDFLKKEYNTNLIITVDHGISANNKIDYAKSCGIQTIVLDHHLKPIKLPKAAAFIHSTKLAASGIAWLFANYLTSKLSNGKIDRSSMKNLDLAAVATVADLIPLVGLNRVIVKYGLEQLNKTTRLGLNALIKISGLDKVDIGVYEIGHILAPRINAMGRMTHALDALRLICTKDGERADDLAKMLSATNRERQIMTEMATSHAISNIKTKNNLDKLIIVSHESYKEGIIGLVAGKLVEEFCLPAIVIAKREEYSKASARSINGLNIVEAIRKVSYLLEDVGGHPMAAGFTIATKNLEEFRQKLSKIVRNELPMDKLEKLINIDIEIDLSSISQEFYTSIQKLAPFGIGNATPIFASRNVKIISLSCVGKVRQHLKLAVSQNTNMGNNTKLGFGRKNNVFTAIGFGMGEYFHQLSPGKFVDIAYTVEEDNWNNNSALQLKLKDVKISV